MNIVMPTDSFIWLIIPKLLKISHKKIHSLVKNTKENNYGTNRKVLRRNWKKIIKDLTFSYVDKQGELWDDRKKEWEKI